MITDLFKEHIEKDIGRMIDRVVGGEILALGILNLYSPLTV